MIKLMNLFVESKADEIESTIRQSFLMNRGSFNTGWKMPKRQYIGLIKSLKKRYGSLVDKIVKELEKYDYIEPKGSQIIWNDGIKVYGSTLNEGVRDPGIFKAVFLAGGPGSGKSYVAQQLFGIPEKINVSKTGLKMVNQDQELESFLRKYFGTVDIDIMPDELFKQLTDPTYDEYSGMRGRTKELSKERLRLYTQGRLGVIIDGTGHKFNAIKSQRRGLMDMGYDTFMVFVNTTLKVALDRNRKRERVLPDDVVKEYWTDCQQNLGKFQSMFGASNMLIVDNSKYQQFPSVVKKAANNFVSKSVQNPIAKAWIKKELELRKQ